LPMPSPMPSHRAVGGGYATQPFHGADRTRLNLLTAAGWTLLAIVVAVRQFRRGGRASIIGGGGLRAPVP
jgi:hypothetical protein